MRIKGRVHQIKIMFHVTPEIERYVYIYLIAGKYCYLIDTGVDGSQRVISEYLKSIGRDISEVKAVLLTHSHPDHIGAADAVKKLSGCKIYACAGEKEWIENIEKQLKERPIPNFKGLLNQSVCVDEIVGDGAVITLEEGITMKVVETGGHSQESLSYYLVEDRILFTGDAIPVVGDIPIYYSADRSMRSLHKIRQLEDIDYYCPAWDSIYMGREGKDKVDHAILHLNKIGQCVKDLTAKYPKSTEDEIFGAVCRILDMKHFTQNPLFKASILSNIHELA